jgi:hypothetical protein
MTPFMELLFQQLCIQRDEYLRLRKEFNRVKNEKEFRGKLVELYKNFAALAHPSQTVSRPPRRS